MSPDEINIIIATCNCNLAKARERRDKAVADVAACVKQLDHWRGKLRETEDDGA